MRDLNPWLLALVVALLTVAPAKAEERAQGNGGWTGDSSLGGNARFFLFAITEDSPGRNDSERAALRLNIESTLEPPAREESETEPGLLGVRFEVHAVLSGTAPIAPGVSARDSSTGSGTRGDGGHRRIDLETDVLRSDLEPEDIRLWAEIDRANVRVDHRNFTLTLGRQPISWGVSYFWPVIDLFGPFSPSAVDRDYKPGVDAARMAIPIGQFSEVEVIAAAQERGPGQASTDWSYGALGRFHVRGTDLGLMAGEFFGDSMYGAFLAGDAGGFGLRAETLFTRVAPRFRTLPQERSPSYWRTTLGMDRLLSARTSLSVELSYNGYGAGNAGDYPLIATSRRVQRGEITSLGREYSGVSISFQASPLLSVAGAVLTNWSDSSTLLQPSLVWSLSNNASAMFGAFVGLGEGTDATGLPGSEYGAVPVTLWGAVKAYF